ncbi:MAG TPA: hypothetical protein VFB43_22520 [Terracidiphilus sp.]|nr:hypothetical protein [Terracidiphilus sp.]
MKKQSDPMHNPQRVPESESQISTLPAPAYTTSKPKGVQDRAHPGHLTHGVAESRTNPVRDQHQVSRSSSRKMR